MIITESFFYVFTLVLVLFILVVGINLVLNSKDGLRISILFILISVAFLGVHVFGETLGLSRVFGANSIIPSILVFLSVFSVFISAIVFRRIVKKVGKKRF